MVWWRKINHYIFFHILILYKISWLSSYIIVTYIIFIYIFNCKKCLHIWIYTVYIGTNKVYLLASYVYSQCNVNELYIGATKAYSLASYIVVSGNVNELYIGATKAYSYGKFYEWCWWMVYGGAHKVYLLVNYICCNYSVGWFIYVVISGIREFNRCLCSVVCVYLCVCVCYWLITGIIVHL